MDRSTQPRFELPTKPQNLSSVFEILTFFIIDGKIFCWVGNRGWKRKTPILFSVQSYEFCMVICIAYFHAENLDYCVYYFLKTSALILLVVVRHSWFFLNILKYIPNICHKTHGANHWFEGSKVTDLMLK